MLKKTWHFLSENFDTLIAIVVTIFAAVFGFFGGKQVILLAGISTTLAIFSFGIIRDRGAREKLIEHIQTLETSINDLAKGKIRSEYFFKNRADLSWLPDRLKAATSTLDLMGTSLLSIAVVHLPVLREMKNNGIKIRILLSNPDNKTLQAYLSLLFLENATAASHINEVHTSLANLVPLVGHNSKGGFVKIRLTDNVQTFGYIGRDVQKPTGKIQVEFYLYKTGTDRDPIFQLESKGDSHWFGEFQNQFEHLWEHSREIDVNNYIQKTDNGPNEKE